MKRSLALLIALVGGLLVGPAASAASTPAPTARLVVSRTVVGAGGGLVTVHATIHNGRRCAWSSTPPVPGFARIGPCSRTLSTRVARIRRNPFQRVRRIVFRLTVTGRGPPLVRTLAVGQVAATFLRPKPTTTTAAATASRPCTPLTNGGNCSEPGEFCRNSDHGVTGVAGDGETIVCADNNGWRWEPVH